MYYLKIPQKTLRFGDVVQGFILTYASIENPNDHREFRIDINAKDLCVLLTPCCSIKKGVINLSPLKRVPDPYFQNPYLAEDMMRLNRKMTRYDAMRPIAREKLSPAQAEEMKSEKDFQFLDQFVYEGNDYFQAYEVKMHDGSNAKVSYYMISFKEIYKVECRHIESPENYPVESKLLQLSIDARRDLAAKVNRYYRVPDEDLEG